MGSRGGGGGGVVGVQSIPAASRKMVQSLKEIVDRPEPEIYAVLKDCNMDPNEAVNRLLSQDPFHEVKSKREKKKEKDPTESRPRGASSTLNRGNRSNLDRYGGRGGSTYFNSSEPGGLQGKPSYGKETELHPYTSSSVSVSGVSGNINSSRRPPSLSDTLITENKASTLSGVDGITSAPQPSSGYQSAWLGAPGQKTMADIVKMGRPQSKSYNTPNPSYHNVDQNFPPVPSSTTTHQIPRSSDDYASKVSGQNYDLGVAQDQHDSPDDEWPRMDPQVTGMTSVMEPRDTELQLGTSNLSYDRNDQYIGSQTDDAHEDDDGTVEDHSLNNVESASVSMRMMQEENSGSTTHYDEGIYNMGSFQTQERAYEHQEVDDNDASISSVNANMQQVSIQEEDHRTTPEDDIPIPAVVIPDHLLVQNADCSHLSFGSFGSAMNTSFSGSLKSRAVTSNLEETPAEADAPSVGHSDSRNPEYYRDESHRNSPDENLVRRLGGNAGAYDSATASQPEVLKQESADVALGSQYNFPSGTPGYNFENAQLLNTSYPQSQASAQMQNLTPFLTQQGYTNSLPSSVLGANGHPVRESDLSYSPFPITQSMPTKYSNTVSSISSSMAEALKTVVLSSTEPTQQMPSANNVAMGPTLPHHLAVHPYSQQTHPLGPPFTNMIGYPFLPPNYTYMPSGFQQAAFAGNSTFHQSLAATVLPQYKNSASVSSWPQSAAAAPGYGAFGSSGTIPGNYPMNPPQPGSSINYDDVLSSQYKDNSHLLSLQQQVENSAMWVHGGGSRTLSAVPANTYYSFQGQNQQPSGFLRQTQQPSQQNFGSPGYGNFYHSQTGISLEHQQQQNPRDGSHGASQGQPKQSQQLWQNGY